MSEEAKASVPIEPERYEFSAPHTYHFELARRDFLRVMGGGIAILVTFRPSALAQESGRRFGEQRLPQEIDAWLHVGEDGMVSVFSGKVEIGQNARTSLTQAVAEELRVPVERIQITLGDTKVTPFDMGTFGSRTTPTMNLQLRRAASAARDLLVGLAAKRWNTDAKRLMADAGRVIDPATRRAASYAELARGQALSQTIPVEDPLEPPAEWKVAGTSVPKVDGRAFVTGRHRYTSDIQRPGMLHGCVVRPASFGAKLASADTRAAEAMPGVAVVHDGDFIGVAAPTRAQAERAIAAIRAEWKETTQPSNRELFEYLKSDARKTEGFEGGSSFSAGSVEQGLAGAQHKLAQTYTVRYIAHAPLEPRAAVAEWSGDALTVWTGTQRPFAVRSELAQAFRIPEDRVRVIVPDTGSAYGGKHTGECAVEAARLARAVGKPVKLLWTREEEFTWAYARPAGVIEVRSGVRNDGTLAAWEFHNYNSGAAGIRTPYSVANQHIEFHSTDSPLRQGSYRGLAATANHFARETHMDELARAAGLDPLAFRLKNLADARLRAAFEAAAKAFGWGRAKPAAGQGFGIAGGVEKGGYVATCAEVRADRTSGAVRVVRLVTAFECGAIVNPDQLKNQVEGAMMMGLGGALFEALDFADGRILNPRFSLYRVPRFSDVPEMEVVLINRKDLAPAGAGETPIVGTAPAVGNAIFDATGVRLRDLPMVPNGLKKTVQMPFLPSHSGLFGK
jgi:nicotinate dehydrogenase subunit B